MRLVLDVTRSIARLTRPFDSGVGRVERAILDYLITENIEASYLGKIGKVQFMFDTRGMKALLARQAEGNWGDPRGIDRFRRKLSVADRSLRSLLGELKIAKNAKVYRALPNAPFRYLSFAHSNMDPNHLQRISRAGGKIEAFIHDTIPSDFPQYSEAHAQESYKGMISSLSETATLIWVNSKYTKSRLKLHLKDAPIRVQRLGVDIHNPSRREFDGLTTPYLLCVGTIEPRKNLSLLLNIWEEMDGAERRRPDLVFVGRRGWESETFYQRFNKSVIQNQSIHYFDDVTDEDLSNLYAHAHGVLFPSFEEGFGLPAAEALKLGIPVIASDIPVFRELYEKHATLIPTSDKEAWKNEIQAVAAVDRYRNRPRPTPSWKQFAKRIVSA